MAKKLFKYFSELIIIIAGISISLFFDELAEDHKKDQLEVYYLQSLADNLREDSISLKSKIQFIEKVEAAADVLLKHFLEARNQKFSSDSIVNSQTALLQHSIFASNKSAYEELKSTGNFVAIKNKQLKNSIFSYYGTTDNTMQDDLSADNVITFYVYEKLNNNLPLSSLANAKNADFHFLFEGIDFGQLELPTSKQVDTNELINAIIIRKGINSAQKAKYFSLMKQNHSLMLAIRKELSEK